MLKSLPAVIVVMFLAAGCVSVAPTTSSPPSGAATAAPTLGVTTPVPATPAPTLAPPTIAPTLAPTVAPTVGPTVAPPTEAPTLTPTVEPSGAPTALPSGAPGTRDLLFDDDMSDPTSGWQETHEAYVTITYDTGVLAFRFNQNPSWAYTVRKLDAPQTTLVSAADFSPQGGGIFGELCGDSTSVKYYGAVVDTNGGLVFLETDSGNINVLERHDGLGLDVTVGGSNHMALECHADGTGAMTMVVGLADTGPIGAYRVDADAPLNFDVLALYGESSSDGYTLTVDRTAAFGVGGPFGTISTGAEALLAHIPTAFQNNCYESPQIEDTAQYKITCIPQTHGKGAEIEHYQQFADADAMNAAYQDLVSTFGVPTTGDCTNGPQETNWSISGTTQGRVQCAPQAVGIRFDWTDDPMSILSSLIDLEGSYKDTYDQWLNAGPI